MKMKVVAIVTCKPVDDYNGDDDDDNIIHDLGDCNNDIQFR